MKAFAVALVIASAALGACSDPVAEAEKRLAMVRQNGSMRDICRQARTVETAALKAGDADRYRDAKLQADGDCLNADLARYPDLPKSAQDMDVDTMSDNLTAPYASPSPAAAIEHEESATVLPAQKEAAACWQDYCPCDETGPIDRMLCRNLRGGLAMDPQLMASGAAMRDARQSLDAWDREHPDMPVGGTKTVPNNAPAVAEAAEPGDEAGPGNVIDD